MNSSDINLFPLYFISYFIGTNTPLGTSGNNCYDTVDPLLSLYELQIPPTYSYDEIDFFCSTDAYNYLLFCDCSGIDYDLRKS